MITRLKIALLLILLPTLSLKAVGTWQPFSYFPGAARQDASAFTLNGFIYFGTGYSNGLFGMTPTYFNDFWKMDPATQVWTQLADYAGGGRAGAYSFGVGGNGYLGGGITDFQGHDQTFAFFKYSPVSNSWTDMTQTVGEPVLFKMSVFTINDVAYLVGGSMLDNFTGTYYSTNEMYKFDPLAGYFQPVTPLGGYMNPALARYEAFAFSINGMGYVGTGVNGSAGNALFNDFWEFNPVTTMWTQKANFPGLPRRGAFGFNVGNEGYAGSGCQSYYMVYNDFYKYDPIMDSWTTETPLWNGLYNGISCSVGNYGYIGTGSAGQNYGFSNEFFRFVPTCTAPGTTTAIAGGATTFCSGGSVTLTATTSGSALSYQWLKNGANISGANSLSYVATSSGSYKIKVSNFCGNVTSNTIQVDVNVIPVAYLSASSSLYICPGSSVILEASSTGLNVSYQWRKNGVNLAGATAQIYTATTAGSYTVVATNACGSGISNTGTVTMLSATTASISAGGSVSFCTGGSVTLTGTASGQGSLTYQWRKDGVAISGATALSYSATTSGSYDLQVSGSCSAVISNAITVIVATGLPQVPASITGPATFCANQQGVAYTASPVPGYVNYFWSLPTGASVASGAGTNSITVNFGIKSGNVRVKTINSCGASNFRSKKVTKVNCRMAAPDETETDEMVEAVKVFPNPADDRLYVEFSTDEAADYTLKLQNLIGQIVYNGSGLSAVDGNELTIDVNDLPAGIYMLILDAEGITNYKKVVIR